MPKLYILRHGQTNYNLENRMQGSINTALNETGKKQAKSIANTLKNISIDVFMCSPLKRAYETATIIKSELNLPNKLIINNEFKEISYGDLNGMLLSDIQKEHPILITNSKKHFYYKPPNGISIAQFEQIILTALNKLLSTYKDKNILLITHGITAALIYKYFNNTSDVDFFNQLPKNCTLMTFDL